ncbi:hypothetical protein BN135_3452 [Cronobacter muytjensii 530]
MTVFYGEPEGSPSVFSGRGDVIAVIRRYRFRLTSFTLRGICQALHQAAGGRRARLH